jgi:MerR family redox-sensitive transcriptional activator SoxR
MPRTLDRLQVQVNLKSRPGRYNVPGMADLLTITQVSRRSGVASSALRFYEQRGLIMSERAGSGHRRYERAALRRIAFIVFAQKMGLSLDEIGAELAKLPANRVPQSADWARLSSSWTRKIDARIAELERLRAGLTQCIGCGCLSLKQCQLANPADMAAGLGPGPRYLMMSTTTSARGSRSRS